MASSPNSSTNKMQFTRLGKTGMKVSRICLGMMSYGTPVWRQWVLGEADSLPFIKRALELGINFFDTANMYSQGVSEEILGKAIRLYSQRENVIIASKVYYPMGNDPTGNNCGLSRKHIMYAIDQTLKRLNMEYLDLYQIHRFDNETPIEETMEALHDLVKSNKVRYIGASSMSCWQFAKMQAVAEKNGWTKFISMQNHYNMVYREEEREMNPYCISEGVGIIPYSPLARGFLAGTRSQDKNKDKNKDKDANKESDITQNKDSMMDAKNNDSTIRANTDNIAHLFYNLPEDFIIVDRVVQLAKTKGVKPAQIALAWLLQKPGVVSPIIGATKIQQLEEAVEALSIQLSEDDIRFLEELYKPHRAFVHAGKLPLSDNIKKTKE